MTRIGSSVLGEFPSVEIQPDPIILYESLKKPNVVRNLRAGLARAVRKHGP